MVLKSCLLAYKKDFPKTSTPARGDETSVTANAILLIPDEIVDHFNIPTVDNISAQSRQIIEEFTYTRFAGFDDATGTPVTVPQHERGGGAAANSTHNVVRLPHGSLRTGRGRPRTCSIRFPSFFNLIMIGQALGTMLKANEPDSWKLDRSGRSYPFVASTATGLIPGYESGAWVVSAPVTSVNTEETSVVKDTTVVKSKGRS